MKKLNKKTSLIAGLSLVVLASCSSNEKTISKPNTTIDTSIKSQTASITTSPVIDDTINWEEEKLGDPMIDPIASNNRVFYEIFPISFSDSNNDGNGDIQGIINRLDYLNDGDMNSGKSLGVQGIWLTPVFKSPTYHKYDTTDYYSIDSTFGTEEDLIKLAEECHKRNIKLIIDLVLNHTSTQHPWFQEFTKSHQSGDTTNKYYNYYEYSTTQESGFSYGIIHGTTEFYQANFGTHMPELNYDNSEVYDEMINVAKYWIDRGIDGFRFDAAKYIYMGQTNKNIEFWNSYCSDIRSYAETTYKKNLYTVAEVWDSSSTYLPYNSALNTFHFDYSQAEGGIAQAAKGKGAYSYCSSSAETMKKVKKYNPNNQFAPFLSNHDMDRSAGYLSSSNGSAQMAANLYLLSGGSPFIYYGEELGMKGSRGGASTDANRRLAMLWGDGDTIKNPEGSTFNTKYQIQDTVSTEVNSKSSLLTYYRHVIEFRNKHPEIADGTYDFLDTDSTLAGYKITYKDSNVALLHNTTTKTLTLDLADFGYSTILDSIGLGSCKMNGTKITVEPQTSVLVQ